MSPLLPGIIASGISGHLTPPWAGPEGAYDSLATVTLSSTASSVTFAGIPSGYKHLQLRGISRGTQANAFSHTIFRINSDSGANYSRHIILADGVNQPPQSYGYTGETKASIGYSAGASSTSGIFGAFVTDILDYSNVNKYKTVRSLCGADNNASSNYSYLSYGSTLWLNTAAITSITISSESANLDIYTQFALYGVK